MRHGQSREQNGQHAKTQRMLLCRLVGWGQPPIHQPPECWVLQRDTVQHPSLSLGFHSAEWAVWPELYAAWKGGELVWSKETKGGARRAVVWKG